MEGESSVSSLIVASQHYSATGVPKLASPTTTSAAAALLPQYPLWAAVVPDCLVEAEMISVLDERQGHINNDLACKLSIWAGEVHIEDASTGAFHSNSQTLRRSRSDSRLLHIRNTNNDDAPSWVHRQHLVVRTVEKVRDVTTTTVSSSRDLPAPLYRMPKSFRWSPTAPTLLPSLPIFSAVSTHVLTDIEYDAKVQSAMAEAMACMVQDAEEKDEIFLSANDDDVTAIPRFTPPPKVEVSSVPFSNNHTDVGIEGLCFVPAHLMLKKGRRTASTITKPDPKRQEISAAVWTLWSVTRSDRFGPPLTNPPNSFLTLIDFNVCNTSGISFQTIHIFDPTAPDQGVVNTINLPWHLDGLAVKLQESITLIQTANGRLEHPVPKKNPPIRENEKDRKRSNSTAKRTINAQASKVIQHWKKQPSQTAADIVNPKPSKVHSSPPNPLWQVLMPNRVSGLNGALPRPFILFSTRAQRVFTIHSVLAARHTVRHCVCVWRLHAPYQLVEYCVLPTIPWVTDQMPSNGAEVENKSSAFCGLPQNQLGSEVRAVSSLIAADRLPMPIISFSIQNSTDWLQESSAANQRHGRGDVLVISFFNMHTLVYTISPPIIEKQGGQLAVPDAVLDLSREISSASAYEMLATYCASAISVADANMLVPTLAEVNAMRLQDMYLSSILSERNKEGREGVTQLPRPANFTELQRRAVVAATLNIATHHKAMRSESQCYLLSGVENYKREASATTNDGERAQWLSILPPYHQAHGNRHTAEDYADMQQTRSAKATPQQSPSRALVASTASSSLAPSPHNPNHSQAAQGHINALVHRMVSRPAEPLRGPVGSTDVTISPKRSPQRNSTASATVHASNYSYSKTNQSLERRVFGPNSFAVKAIEAMGKQRQVGLLRKYWVMWSLLKGQRFVGRVVGNPPNALRRDGTDAVRVSDNSHSPIRLLWEGPINGKGGLLLLPLSLFFGNVFDLGATKNKNGHSRNKTDGRLPSLLNEKVFAMTKNDVKQQDDLTLTSVIFGSEHFATLKRFIDCCRQHALTIWLTTPASDIANFETVAADKGGTISYAAILRRILEEIEYSSCGNVTPSQNLHTQKVVGCICGLPSVPNLEAESTGGENLRSLHQHTQLNAFFQELDREGGGISYARALDAETRLAAALMETLEIHPLWGVPFPTNNKSQCEVFALFDDMYYMQCLDMRMRSAEGSQQADLIPKIFTPTGTCTDQFRTSLLQGLAEVIADSQVHSEDNKIHSFFELVKQCFLDMAKGMPLVGAPSDLTDGSGQSRKLSLHGSAPRRRHAEHSRNLPCHIPFRVVREQSFTGECYVNVLALATQ